MGERRAIPAEAKVAAEIVASIVLARGERTEIEVGDAILRYASGPNETSAVDAHVGRVCRALADDELALAVAVVHETILAMR
jgi:hypothetical protein